MKVCKKHKELTEYDRDEREWICFSCYKEKFKGEAKIVKLK